MWQRWEHVLFAHWPLPVETLAAKLPVGLKLDSYDGVGWLGIVLFSGEVSAHGLEETRAKFPFAQCNLRTYVTCRGKPGAYFLSLDATDPLSVRGAKWLYHLPYHDARIRLEEIRPSEFSGDVLRVGQEELRYAVRYQPQGETFSTPDGSLEAWLTERYCLFSLDKKGQLYTADIHHPPWPLQYATATITYNTLPEVYGFLRLPGAPHLLYCAAQEMLGWLPKKLTTSS